MPIGLPTPYGGGLLAPQATGGGGFYGFSPLTQFGLGLLSQSGPSLTPQSPWAAIGKAGAYASEAQQNAIQNELIRAKLAESAKATQATAKLQELVRTGGIKPPEGWTTDAFSAAVAADPDIIGKTVRPIETPQDLLAKAQLAELLRKSTGETAETVSQTVQTFGNIKEISDSSTRLAKSDSIFQPGGFLDKVGGVDAAGGALALARASGLKEVMGIPIEQLELQVTDAQAVNKATSGMALALQAVNPSNSRSATALRTIQSSVGQNMLWTARRRMLATNLDPIIADIETQGIQDQIPNFQEIKDLNTELKKQNAAFIERGEKAEAVPANMQPQTSTTITPQPGVPSLSVAPPQAEAAPAPRSVPTQNMMTTDVPGVGQVQGRVFPREADGRRATKPGDYYFVRKPNGEIEVWQH